MQPWPEQLHYLIKLRHYSYYQLAREMLSKGHRTSRQYITMLYKGDRINPSLNFQIALNEVYLAERETEEQEMMLVRLATTKDSTPASFYPTEEEDELPPPDQYIAVEEDNTEQLQHNHFLIENMIDQMLSLATKTTITARTVPPPPAPVPKSHLPGIDYCNRCRRTTLIPIWVDGNFVSACSHCLLQDVQAGILIPLVNYPNCYTLRK